MYLGTCPSVELAFDVNMSSRPPPEPFRSQGNKVGAHQNGRGDNPLLEQTNRRPGDRNASRNSGSTFSRDHNASLDLVKSFVRNVLTCP